MIALLALLSVQVPATPPVRRYRLEIKTQNEWDQTVAHGPKLVGGLVTRAVISVAMTDTTGGQIAHVTVDSMYMLPSGTVAEQMKQHPDAGDHAVGASVRAYIVAGKLHDAPQVSDSTNPALGAVVQAVGVLFPGIKRGAKVGDAWADTTRINNSAGPRRQTGEVVATWKVSAAEGDALVLEGTSTTHTRTEDGSGQLMTMSGDTHERVVIPPSGPARSASIDTNNTMSVTTPTIPAPIPGKNSGSLLLTPLP